MSRSVFDPEAGKPEPIWVPIDVDIMKQGMMGSFLHGREDAARFIVSLDLMMADWGVHREADCPLQGSGA